METTAKSSIWLGNYCANHIELIRTQYTNPPIIKSDVKWWEKFIKFKICVHNCWFATANFAIKRFSVSAFRIFALTICIIKCWVVEWKLLSHCFKPWLSQCKVTFYIVRRLWAVKCEIMRLTRIFPRKCACHLEEQYNALFTRSVPECPVLWWRTLCYLFVCWCFS